MKRLNVNIRPDQKESLDRLSEKTGESISMLIRFALDRYLNNHSVLIAEWKQHYGIDNERTDD